MVNASAIPNRPFSSGVGDPGVSQSGRLIESSQFLNFLSLSLTQPMASLIPFNAPSNPPICFQNFSKAGLIFSVQIAARISSALLRSVICTSMKPWISGITEVLRKSHTNAMAGRSVSLQNADSVASAPGVLSCSHSRRVANIGKIVVVTNALTTCTAGSRYVCQNSESFANARGRFSPIHTAASCTHAVTAGP